MWGFVVLLAVWMTYVETEMPNRTNECEFDNSCEIFNEPEISDDSSSQCGTPILLCCSRGGRVVTVFGLEDDGRGEKGATALSYARSSGARGDDRLLQRV